MSLAVIGAGGHARVVIGLCRALGLDVRGLYDDFETNSVMGVPILGTTSSASGPAVLAIGDNRVRQRLSTLPCQWLTLVHPAAWVDPTVRLGAGSVVFAGAVIQPEAVLGSHCIVNTSASVDHECRLADFAQVAPGAHLGGRVIVGEGAFLGIGASVIQGIEIGAWATVGAGAAVVKHVEPGVQVVGVPAKPRVRVP
ncbi:MAG TPA: acetyltransferase [Fimbriimonadaceae bacterium]|nr:acetyltransferase [Fimbriimonadaceae bacterium]